jgi:hypothetical protein
MVNAGLRRVGPTEGDNANLTSGYSDCENEEWIGIVQKIK